ncbi:heterokaryon incompatibility protein-domain-containing protein [Aspergillus avenaceus]|uniref:Heterokaryon incompatibility protein-domain-containing protein n=1 Tax=Aspergillus avenaceus TaxID=36643 RepID=A0A5N6U2J7_ASPAV|nr:heterokaryon incompatibility protein-domain-containing protein [Aspergillus avenaceus]
MRLLNARTFQLEWFDGNHLRPEYAILSHTWSTQEISLQQLHSEAAPRRWGYQKIDNCCRQALLDGLEYVWVDTCCIDQSSSAEVSEAISSMFEWYRASTVCYAYLEDVDEPYSARIGHTYYTYAPTGDKSRWYTRGWTLQELLAPSNVVFYNKNWHVMGTKVHLVEEISDATGIDDVNLIHYGIRPTSVGQKLSWAAGRKTTREEDQAYCLLGLLGVHIPLLYGEGHRAFRRLQEEVIRSSTDMSIFAWDCHERSLGSCVHWGILARSPNCFSRYSCVSFIPYVTHNVHISGCINGYERVPFAVTNAGLRIALPLIQLPPGEEAPEWLLNEQYMPSRPVMRRSKFDGFPLVSDTYIAILNCGTFDFRTKRTFGVGIALQRNKQRGDYECLIHSGLIFIDLRNVSRAEFTQIIINLGHEAERPVLFMNKTMLEVSTHIVVRPQASLRCCHVLVRDYSGWLTDLPKWEGTILLPAVYRMAVIELDVEGLPCTVVLKSGTVPLRGRVLECGITSRRILDHTGLQRLWMCPSVDETQTAPDGTWMQKTLENDSRVAVSIFRPGVHYRGQRNLEYLIYVHCILNDIR